jgi:predicted transcriptional regulator
MKTKTKVKLIILTEEDNSIPKEAIEEIGKEKFWFISTRDTMGETEYRYLDNSIEGFIKTDREVLVAKFSGREDIAKMLGDERSEVIVHLKKESGKEEYSSLFKNLLESFYKETV